MLLTVSLAVIATALAASTIAFEIRRDREEEMIHRGVQYTRAIRSYAKKTGHYPMDIHELIDAHGAKYIRKLYKDPITGKDFRFLHTADIMSKTDLNASLHNTSASDSGDTGLSTDTNSATSPDAGNTAPLTRIRKRRLEKMGRIVQEAACLECRVRGITRPATTPWVE